MSCHGVLVLWSVNVGIPSLPERGVAYSHHTTISLGPGFLVTGASGGPRSQVPSRAGPPICNTLVGLLFMP